MERPLDQLHPCRPRPVGEPGPRPETAPEADDGSVLADLDLDALRHRLATQPVIEQAKGMIMGYYGLDADQAFALLRRWSSTMHVKLRDLCERLVTVAGVPDPHPYGALRRLLDELEGPERR